MFVTDSRSLIKALQQPPERKQIRIYSFFIILFFIKADHKFHLYAVQKMKFSIKVFFGKCYHIRSFLLIWSHLLKKSLMENFIF